MLIVRKGKAFVPTLARTEAGFYLEVEPVEVAGIVDRVAVESAILRAVERGNPTVPTPSRDNFPARVVLKHAGVRSSSAFEKLARTWQLSKHGDAFAIIPYRPADSGSGFVEDTQRRELLPATRPLSEVVHRLVERAMDDAREPSPMPRS